MIAYIIRRILYAIPILIGVNLITFLLFFMVNTPDDMARIQLGVKHVTQPAIEKWKKDRGYDKPLLINTDASGVETVTNTIFFTKSLSMFWLDFGQADDGSNISYEIKNRALPSLSLAIPVFICGLIAAILTALFLALFKGSKLDRLGVSICILMMSISALFYVIGGQFIFAKVFAWFPFSGFSESISNIRFLLLPTIIGVLTGLGGASRWYRNLLLEEMNKEYVRAAKAKGITDFQVLYRHVLPNAMIPILTGVVVVIPSLFMGSLILESFFAIPGLGSYTLDAINAQDFAIVRAMVFMGSLLYIVGLLLTDISYSLIDPSQITLASCNTSFC
jgi:peptide/nickel transport system permease protein